MSDTTDVTSDVSGDRSSVVAEGAGPTATARRRRSGSGLTAMLLPELQNLASSLGISGIARMRKGELVAAIQDRQGGDARPAVGRADVGGRGQVAARVDAPRAEVRADVAEVRADGAEAGTAMRADAPVDSEVRRTRRASRPAGPPEPRGTGGEADSAGRGETFGRADSASRPDVNGRADGSARVDAGWRADGRDVAERPGDGGFPPDRPERTVVSTNDRDTDRVERPERGGRTERGDRNDRPERGERPGRGDRGGRTDGNVRTDGNRSDGNRSDGNRSDPNRSDGNSRSDERGGRGDVRTDGRGDVRNDGRGDGRNDGRNEPRGNDPRDDADDDGDGGNRRGRRSRFRDRRRGRGERVETGTGGGGGEPQAAEDDVLVPVAGILDVLENYGFIRTTGYLAGSNDVYVSMSQVKKYGLRRGDAVTGAVRQIRDSDQRRDKYNPLIRLDTVNGMEPEEARRRPEYYKLTPLYPQERLRLETEPHILTTRVIDIVMPLGKGQRALIVSPPKAGKTMVLQAIANAITRNNPECHLMVVLVDERPEEVTDMQRSVKGEVIASTFDRPPGDHTMVAELAIERAKRLVELGHDVVVLLDSITRLGRAYNLEAKVSGRILSGGIDSTALYPPKRFLGAARN
ncbi:MAG: transcription termination factor Rho, partial [Micromonosporaceae bacterium]|nr:transcription termination factor Rho [Micromonosporaceae bacterium]